MSDIHVLDGTNGNVRLACHLAIPSAVNLAGINQQVAWKNSGLAKISVMAVGTGPGQIAQAENDALLAGTLAEVIVNINPDGVTGPALQTVLQMAYAQATQQGLVSLYGIRWYGATAAKS